MTLDDAPLAKGIAVRGVLEAKTGSDILEYFDENIVHKPKVVKRSKVVSLKIEQLAAGITGASDDDMAAYEAQLDLLDEIDLEKRRKADAKNALESFCYEMKEKLYDEELEAVTTEDERDSFRDKLGEASDWLEYEADDASTADFRFDHLVSLCSSSF